MLKCKHNDVIEIDFNDVKNQTILSVYKRLKTNAGSIIVSDNEFNDFYEIKLKSGEHGGVEGLCFCNHRPSQWANFFASNELMLKTVINNMAGGEVLK